MASEWFQKWDGCPFPLCQSVKSSDSNLIFLVAPTGKKKGVCARTEPLSFQIMWRAFSVKHLNLSAPWASGTAVAEGEN